tara:strand:- start:97 stop:1638 length:1542 start_codon:yes stop_codon:yes gene_type:complete
MAQDYLSVVTPNTDLTVADFDGRGPGTSTDLSTGDIRRKYNFGDRVSELAIAQDPFFRFLSKASKKPTDDPQFKWTEKRDSWHKRYAYVMGFISNGSDEFGDAELDQSDAGAAVSALGHNVKLYMATDYSNQGNVQNVYGNTSSKYDVGASGTRPAFFIPGQIIKVPVTSVAGGAGAPTDYHLVKISNVVSDLTKDSKECVRVDGSIVKVGGSNELASFHTNNFSPSDDSAGDEVVADKSIASTLEGSRSYVVGTAFAEGSGYPETWKDQPYSTNHGLTQIWKTSCAMTNTARATVLKYEPNEWARVWKEKLIEHKFDIETSLLFGSQTSQGGVQYTQGVVDYISNFGNSFSLDINTKTADDFLDDMSNYVDPRYNSSTATVFFVSTAVFNWMHKLGGYFKNNLEISPNMRADFAMTGKKKVLGVDITTFSTPYGDMNVARNIHLDGTNIKMLGINMKYAHYRPLVGNGVNRDTSVYVGVQTLENSGVDRRVDLILTEAGLELSMPECHAMWT